MQRERLEQQQLVELLLKDRVLYLLDGNKGSLLKEDLTLLITTLERLLGSTLVDNNFFESWDQMETTSLFNLNPSHNSVLFLQDGKCVSLRLLEFTSSTTTRRLRLGTILDFLLHSIRTFLNTSEISDENSSTSDLNPHSVLRLVNVTSKFVELTSSKILTPRSCAKHQTTSRSD